MIHRQTPEVALLKWRLHDHAGSRSYRRLQRHLSAAARASPDTASWLPLLCAIALIETRERRRLARALEWAARSCFLSASITCGPLQMRQAPWRLSDAVRFAVHHLTEAGCTPSMSSENLRKVAAAWNGAADVQRGAVVGYADALNLAAVVLRRLDAGRHVEEADL